MHTLSPLNTSIQSEAVIEVSESDFDSEILRTVSDWIGPDVCAQRFSLHLPLHLTLVHERENPLGTRVGLCTTVEYLANPK